MTPQKFLRRSASALAVVAAVTLGACGGGDSAPADTLPAEVGLTVTAVPSIRWDAADYTASAGDVLVGLVNEDSVRHTLIIAKDGTKIPDFKLVTGKKGDVDSGNITLEAGTYQLLCDVPGHQNMKATLTVS
jgi:plastocyanin